MTISKHGRFFALRDAEGELIAITVYKKGAREIIRRLDAAQTGVVSPRSKNQNPNGKLRLTGRISERAEIPMKNPHYP
jgi:hypothetical protein